ncbi:hypothetical protein [Ligilactobacillus ruminis]|uniref:hypothetical protein n=1 Tax=Ligilactobacillus ruminis TaxID=1623 RepID=UPI001C032AEE|nr:hypothetical protein [Ligilactobacillus ruminis]MBT9628256.1 hypothetical protein [Ligilactobacillus ruminis]
MTRKLGIYILTYGEAHNRTNKLYNYEMFTVTYRMYNTDAKENIGNMTVNKENKKYALDYADEMTTHFETATYRFIVGAIERGIYPEYAYDGWG